MTYPPAGGVASAWWGVHWAIRTTTSSVWWTIWRHEADDAVAQRLQVGVAGTVFFEGGAVAVGLPAVGLDDELVLGPEEVDAVGANPALGERIRQACLFEGGEEDVLQLRLRRLGFAVGAVDEAAVQGLRGRSAVGGIFERLRGRRDRQAVLDRRLYARGPVDPDAGALTRSSGRQRHLDQLRH